MAHYDALTALSQTLEQIPQLHVHQQITSLHDKVSRLLEILGDFQQESSLMTRHLEGKIRDASCEAKDIIESNTSGKSLISPPQDMIPAIHPRQRLVDTEFHGLEQILDEFESILVDVSDKINDGRVEELQITSSPGAGSSRFPASNESPPVGLDEDLLQLKDRLFGSTSNRDIISIVGMGGIGKTTLARYVYNDSFTEEHFHIRAWIVVSQKYDVREMLTGLLYSIGHDGGGKLHQWSIPELAELLYKSLFGTRYLIVLDDVWRADVWLEFEQMFPDNKNGSRIILTTRQEDISGSVSAYVLRMSLLSPEASWNLLREKVFGNGSCPSAVENEGKKIAKNCKGLPQTIILTGELLYEGIKTQEYWQYIAENLNSALSEHNDQFMERLSLSYNSLPRHLKPCFLYMGVFPEDYEIFVSQLIKLWIAEGFIKSLPGKSLEKVAKGYLKDLINRNLIMVREKKWNGEIKTCVLHDAFRELCIKKAQDEKFVQILNWEVLGFPEGRNNNLRVSFHSNIVDCLVDIDESYVHSFLFFCKPRSELLSFTMSCRLLRVFAALTVRFYEFPIEIVELVHLRYLAFFYRGNSFPTSISKLRNLQTLIALSVQPIYLPPTMWEMPQLRHLLFEESFLSPQIVWKNSVVPKNLQTLSGIINFRCTKEVVKLVRSLEKLGISYIHDTDTKWSSYEINNFVFLFRLEKLKCLFIAERLQAERSLPINFAFPFSLKKLTLSGCRIPWEKMTDIVKLRRLEVLKLKDHAFEGPVWGPIEGKFISLKFLLIDMSFLEHWLVEKMHFPRLEHLSLSFCPKLAEIPTKIGENPMLQMLELYECSSSAVDSALRIEKERPKQWRNVLRVRVNSFSDYHYSQQQKSLRKVHSSVSAW